jgi:hypothetical protein
MVRITLSCGDRRYRALITEAPFPVVGDVIRGKQDKLWTVIKTELEIEMAIPAGIPTAKARRL